MPHLLHTLAHALLHAAKETAVLLPFLFLTYFGLEFLERRAGEKAHALVARSGKAGPLIGALLGAVPQCGFSAAGAGLYAGRVITTGTLLAIFWSTSDEMLPLLLMERDFPLTKALTVLGVKVIFGMLAGFAVDALSRLLRGRREQSVPESIGEMCRSGRCDCEHHPMWLAALIHTGRIALAVFGVCALLHTALELLGQDALAAFIGSTPYLACLLCALVGLIPNCTSSVVITTLYLKGVISAGAMFSGLLVGAGVGLLVLFRANRPLRDTLRVTAILFAVGALFGVMFDALSLGQVLGI